MIALIDDAAFCSCGVFGYATADTVEGAVEDTPLRYLPHVSWRECVLPERLSLIHI